MPGARSLDAAHRPVAGLREHWSKQALRAIADNATSLSWAELGPSNHNPPREVQLVDTTGGRGDRGRRVNLRGV